MCMPICDVSLTIFGRLSIIIMGAPPPPASPPPLSTTGPCTVDSGGACVRSSGFPTHNYGNSESCVVSGVWAVPLIVRAFHTESSTTCRWDYLEVRLAPALARTHAAACAQVLAFPGRVFASLGYAPGRR